ININSHEKAFDQNLQETSILLSKLCTFTSSYSKEELCAYMDDIASSLEDVDVISIVNADNIRIYHTNHELIETEYDGTHPDFSTHEKKYYTENSTGPSGPQRRSYAAIYDENGNYLGFLMAIKLRTSIRSVTYKTILLFLLVTVFAIVVELIFLAIFFKKIKSHFLAFTEDFEGTKFLVDSMRANNHDFTNKLHVILGLIQIGQYDKAVSYIENISIIQKEMISTVMKSIDNPSFSALIIGKIARASECNVKFIIKDGICYKSSDISIPSEALVTITGNLIENAIDSMNTISSLDSQVKELEFGVFTRPGKFLLTVKDTGSGISSENQDKVFEKGFSTKGENRGVGLYHTKKLVENLGGKISFESKENSGTCFIVEIEKKDGSK
nr:Spo0B domain-containing protein [Treponemataceae bacterium]